LKAASAGAFVALLALSGCGGGTAGNQSSANEVNAAAIATDAARMSANQMHNQMEAQPRQDGAMGGMTNESHGMGMGNMKADPSMKQGNMPATGGNTMSNQAMPMEREPHM
jgi:hypothetical protein